MSYPMSGSVYAASLDPNTPWGSFAIVGTVACVCALFGFIFWLFFRG